MYLCLFCQAVSEFSALHKMYSKAKLSLMAVFYLMFSMAWEAIHRQRKACGVVSYRSKEILLARVIGVGLTSFLPGNTLIQFLMCLFCKSNALWNWHQAAPKRQFWGRYTKHNWFSQTQADQNKKKKKIQSLINKTVWRHITALYMKCQIWLKEKQGINMKKNFV